MTRQPRTPTDSPERFRVGSDEIAFRVTSDESAGALLAAEVLLPAGGGPPMLHRHAPEELYRVERGELAIYLEDEPGQVRRVPARPGSVVHIPGGRAHTVRNESDDDAFAYVVFTPGAEIEQFLRTAGMLALTGEPRIEDVLALAERHGITMAGPVPATGDAARARR
jgi:oxalate decarboxylase/phosphoglucose isomerase-like protein (cupin superfamily)